MTASQFPSDRRGRGADSHEAIVGAIYECVLDPTGWSAVLARICAAVGGAAAWIAVHYPHEVRSLYEIEVGTDPEYQQRLRAHYVGASPFIGATHYVRQADVVSVGDVVDYDEFLAGKFYREWAAPQGWPDIIMGVLAREASRFTWLGICLHEQATPEHKAAVASFLPHVERAVRISDLLEQRSAQAADLAAMAESLATGMILVDAGKSLRGINESARALIKGVRGLSIAGGRLQLPAAEAGRALDAAIGACAQGRLDSAGATAWLAAPMSEEAGLVVHVLPLTRPQPSSNAGAVAALFLNRPDAATIAPIDAFVGRFGLTPSETRVLLALLDGQSPRDIAERQGVAMPTVRTHLRRLYDKTGTKGQSDIVRMIASAGKAI